MTVRVKRRLAQLASAAVALCATTPPSAQEFRCAALKPSGSLRPAYERVAPNRCEGHFERSVSQPFVELVSLTRGPPKLAGSAAVTLRGLPNRSARLIIQPLRTGPFYRVDALLDGDGSLVWDPMPMLKSTGLALRDLGFLALAAPLADTSASDATAVVPVAVGPAAMMPAELHAVLRPSVALSALAWRRYRLGSADGVGDWREVPNPSPYAWTRIPLTIELPGDGLGVQIDVRALDADGNPLALLRFAVVGPNDGGR